MKDPLVWGRIGAVRVGARQRAVAGFTAGVNPAARWACVLIACAAHDMVFSNRGLNPTTLAVISAFVPGMAVGR